MPRVAASAFGLAILLMAAAYGFDATESSATPEGVLAAIVAVAIGASGLLYAWRLGAGGLVD
jgi:multisubunit Na+/H+ antiporter MnhB subunit